MCGLCAYSGDCKLFVIDFPLCCLANDVQDHIYDELKYCSEDDVDRILSYCLEELITEINKGNGN